MHLGGLGKLSRVGVRRIERPHRGPVATHRAALKAVVAQSNRLGRCEGHPDRGEKMPRTAANWTVESFEHGLASKCGLAIVSDSRAAAASAIRNAPSPGCPSSWGLSHPSGCMASGSQGPDLQHDAGIRPKTSLPGEIASDPCTHASPAPLRASIAATSGVPPRPGASGAPSRARGVSGGALPVGIVPPLSGRPLSPSGNARGSEEPPGGGKGAASFARDRRPTRRRSSH